MSSESDLSNSLAPSPKQRPPSKFQQASLTRIVKAQVTLLLSSLNNDNYSRKTLEINNLIEAHGQEIRQHLIRYLLSDVCKHSSNQDNSLHFTLLKETSAKLEAALSFSLALDEFCKSDLGSAVDLEDLFNRLEIDSFYKIIFTLPLFSSATLDLIEKARSIFTANFQHAILIMSNLKSIPEDVFKHMFDSISNIMANNLYHFDHETLQQLINISTKHCTDKSISHNLFKQSIVEIYMTNPSSVTHIFELAKELDALPDILDTLPIPLALDLLYIASSHNLINLDSWFRQKLNASPQQDTFIVQLLDYINQKITADSQSQNVVSLPVPLPILNTYLKILSESSLSPHIKETVKEVQSRCLQALPLGTEASFSPEVEAEANLYYERVYSGELSLDAMILLFKKLHVSKESHDQNVFACMIHNLFDEYSFFPKYPDKELSITSILFGSLIQQRLVSNAALNVALRYVLEALRNPLGSKMFNFGVQALRQFQSRLNEWPQYCSHLLQIPDLIQSQPDIAVQLQPTTKKQNTCYFNSVHVPILSNDQVNYTEPTSAIQDKILFIINNVAQNNVKDKVADLSRILEPSCFKWFSNYLIVKRISTEPNYHELYISVLNSLNIKLLDAHILSETYANIIILLNSEKTVTNSSERALLKNLGSWLGRLTLAKNKPILHKYAAFKELLLEGYNSQRLIVTIPFVCKVLEQCQHSKVFKPPNPWLMAIIKFLVELYESADLKLNLKFEIEVLCKSLLLELNSITPTCILKSKPKEPPQNIFGPSTPKESEKPYFAIPSLAPYIVFNTQISLYNTQPEAKHLVLQACTESIRDIIGPVVERAVAIAVVSTRDLITKDFMMESDEIKMRKAAHSMAQNLAASLAMVTSKEPLRASIVSNLKTIFLAHGLKDNMAEQAIILTVADNLDLMCAVIEKAAMEKATAEVDQVLSNAFTSRRSHREQRPNQPFVDVEMYQVASNVLNMLPPILCPTNNGLQSNVYESFMKIPRVAPSADLESNVPPMPAHMILDRFAQFMNEMEKLLNTSTADSMNNLSQQNEIRSIIRQVTMLAMSSFDKAEATRTFAQKVVQLLYKSDKLLAIEVYVVLLEQLCEVSPNVGALVTSWLTHADDERKYNVPVTVALIKAGLIDLPEQDQELAALIEGGRMSAIEFSARLIRACLYGEQQLATQREFMASLGALSRLNPNQVPESVLNLMEDMHKPKVKDPAVAEQLRLFFAEWVRLYQHPNTTEKVLLAFATQLYQQNMFKVDDVTCLFYRICVEVSIDHAIKFKMVPGQAAGLAYQPIDALAKLIVCLMQVPSEDPVAQFKRCLSVIVLCIAHHHQMRGQQFDQRPFLRLLTCILSELNVVEHHIQSIYLPLLTEFSNSLYTLQPIYFPGFMFAWLQLVANRFFMPQLLLAENQKGWPAIHRLLISLFQFLTPSLEKVEFQDTTRLLYRGTLRVLLVLLHDFPQFLCDYHYSFCNVLPPTCIQLRNLILSAFPRHMRLPDPFTPNLKIDLLPEIHQTPRILADYTTVIEEHELKRDLDVYLETGKATNGQFLKHLCSKLNENNTELINAVVFYLGTVAISKGIPVNQGPSIEIYHYLITELDSESRYMFVSAIVNQLRYPNSHTHYFSCVILYLFVQLKSDIAKEQMTRVLLERLIVNRPHPWGLLITFIELIRNPSYSFWSHSFTKREPDIEKLFESVSRSINHG